MKQAGALAVAVAVASLAAACTDPAAPGAPSVATPTITDTFTGTLTIGGANIHPFTVNQVGGLKVTLVSEDTSVAVLVSVGTPSAATGQCVPLGSATTAAGSTPQLSGSATTTGQFCVSIADIGNLTGPVVYTINVLHS